MDKEMPHRIFHQFYANPFEKVVNQAVLGMFKKQIRDNYFVSNFTQFPDGMWVVRLERTDESYQEEREQNE